jgi:acyl-coenzyme A thioesterase 9
MDMLRPLADPDGRVPDLRLSGHVSYATESSLEVFVRLSTLPKGPDAESETILLGRFAMACRSTSGGKQKIAKLIVEGKEEEELWRMGKEQRESKKARQAESLEARPPNEQEAKRMHSVFIGMEDIYSTAPPSLPPSK